MKPLRLALFLLAPVFLGACSSTKEEAAWDAQCTQFQQQTAAMHAAYLKSPQQP